MTQVVSVDGMPWWGALANRAGKAADHGQVVVVAVFALAALSCSLGSGARRPRLKIGPEVRILSPKVVEVSRAH